ncbi:CDP-glycerol glycerophosphotransferase family protein [Priestia aryabhattai]|uniref:CDP-glycerol glycerophosphotransferase family protein n=1 Tax=Priestia aryabhattai TaxID=412384 RepID=UPI002E202855|nr:CDP-glycerol glycerophosphotransferase family protein [Priestia aryabhattai]MED3946216.1 CDP-glycerol glycerophosphotransferase family protein [Priestia aryabhattai]
MSYLYKGIKKIIKLFIYNISKIVPKNQDLYLFGSWFGNKFADNTKYLYLEAMEFKNINAIWITKNPTVYKEMKQEGLNVLLNNSFKGIWAQLRCKVFFTSTGEYDLDEFLLGGALHFNLWHGIPIKKIMFDDLINFNSGEKHNRIVVFLVKFFSRRKNKLNSVLATSKTIQGIYESAFRIPKENIPIMAQPRNNIFYTDKYNKYVDIPNELLERKTILYMPTHRKEGKEKQDIDKILDLNGVNEFCEKYNFNFIIKQHYYHHKENVDVSEYSNIKNYNNINIDTQVLLKYADILITDYSSCFIDYLLLNRPIIFYAYDKKDYELSDREFYFNYKDITPGFHIEKRSDLLKALFEIKKADAFEEDRQAVRKVFYDEESLKLDSGHLFELIKKNKVVS